MLLTNHPHPHPHPHDRGHSSTQQVQQQQRSDLHSSSNNWSEVEERGYISSSSNSSDCSSISNDSNSSSVGRHQSHRIGKANTKQTKTPPMIPEKHHQHKSNLNGTVAFNNKSRRRRSHHHRHRAASSKSSREPAEVFLRNPKTGGFDYTPAVQDYEQHLKNVDLERHGSGSSHLRRRHPLYYNNDDDDTTLHDSTVYTSYTRQPLLPKKDDNQEQALEEAPNNSSTQPSKPHKDKKHHPLSILSPRSKTSFKQYFSTKASKTPNAVPDGATAVVPTVTPSPAPANKKTGFLKQLKCMATTAVAGNHTSSPPKAIQAQQNLEEEEEEAPAEEQEPSPLRQSQSQQQPRTIQSMPSKDSSTAIQSYMEPRADLEELEEQSPAAVSRHIMDMLIMNSVSTRQRQGYRERVRSASTTSFMETPPRSGRSPLPVQQLQLPPKQHHHQQVHHPMSSLNSLSSSSMERSLMDRVNDEEDDDDDDDDDDDEDDILLFPKRKTKTSSPFYTASMASSCLDFSFSTVGPQSTICNGSATTPNNNQAIRKKKKKSPSEWSFEAVSPVLCGATNASKSASLLNTTMDDSLLIMDSELDALCLSASGFDADFERTFDGDTTTIASTLDVRPAAAHESYSMQSSGAMLLTEAGLKRHDEKRLQAEHVEPLTLRQPNGAGKLEKQVLQQKVERLQAKELQRQADESLEEERAARRKRRQQRSSGNDVEDRSSAAVLRESPSTPAKRSSPPRNNHHHHHHNHNNNSHQLKSRNTTAPPNSMSPQTSTGPSPPAAATAAVNTNNNITVTTINNNNNNHKKPSFFQKMFKKKPGAEELKRQWKERERQRVQLAQLEREEAERQERQRIESLRQSYLEKQRQLEAASSATKKKVVVDVDDVPPSPPALKSRIVHVNVDVDVDDMVVTAPNNNNNDTSVDVDDLPGNNNTSGEVDVDDVIAQDCATIFIASSPPLDEYLSSSNNSKQQGHNNKQDLKKQKKRAQRFKFHSDGTLLNNAPNNSNKDLSSRGSNSTIVSGTVSSTTTTQLSALGPCCVCHERERTHIAMPCMHFAFCEQCVRNRTVCPMCTTENVIFSRVNTE